MIENFTIRDYTEKDFEQVTNLWQQTGMSSPVRGDTADVINRTIAIGGKLLVMEDRASGIICGTSWMTNDGRRIMLHHFGILPEFQGRGLSKLLLEKSLEYVKEKGIQVKLEVHSSNTKAINLYTKLGFSRLGDFMVYIIRDISKL